MTLPIYIVNAFAKGPFTGNPAAVCPLEIWLSTEQMQIIAMQNNLSETVFFAPTGDNSYHIRWFTPKIEVDLCGHATLATAHILFTDLGFPMQEIFFQSRSGQLTVKKVDDMYQLDFPSDQIVSVENFNSLTDIFGEAPVRVAKGKHDLLVEFNDESIIKRLNPDFRLMKELPYRGVIATTKGHDCDFVSRCFYPAAGIDEDPATGSAHTTLSPYWHQRTGKTDFTAYQLSSRRGYFKCSYTGNRTLITGACETYSRGEFYI